MKKAFGEFFKVFLYCKTAKFAVIHFQEVLKSKIDRGKIERGLILRNEKANDEYTTEFLTRYTKFIPTFFMMVPLVFLVMQVWVIKYSFELKFKSSSFFRRLSITCSFFLLSS